MNLKKNLIAFFVIGAVGSLSHFVYEWTNKNYIIGLFFPVNESTWEHLKLLFFPGLVYFLIAYFMKKEKPKNYFPALAISLIWGMTLIVTLFYSISGVLGFNSDFINIIIYFISVAATLCKRNKILASGKYSSNNALVISLFYLTVMTLLLMLFSYNPPNLGIFENPIP